MNKYWIYVLVLIGVLGAGVTVVRQATVEPVKDDPLPAPSAGKPMEKTPEQKPVEPILPEKKKESIALPQPQIVTNLPPVKKTVRELPSRQPPTADSFWKKRAEQFNRKQMLLDEEEDPSRRERLIRSLAQYVRVDTLTTLDWAMAMEDPEEQRLALEAINDYALVGIGAKLEASDSGYPRIQDTTILSASMTTGKMDAGDYIVGIRDEEGEILDFKNLPMLQVVKLLRGEAGTEVSLVMENDQAQPYDVVVQRSLIVIQPPEL